MSRKAKMFRKFVMAALLVGFLAGPAGQVSAQSPQDQDNREVVKLLKEQNRELSRDLRHIRREIAALKAQIKEPGLSDVFAGIGYIFGLFGVGALVAARRRR